MELVLVLLTAVLAATTVFYAIETRRTRLQAIAPVLTLGFHPFSKMTVLPELVNVGMGAARNVDVTIAFVPADGSSAERVERRWRHPLIEPGGRHAFISPEGADYNDQFSTLYQSVQIKGTALDSTGTAVIIDASIDDLREWYLLSKGALHYWRHDHDEDLLEQITAIREAVETLATQRPTSPQNAHGDHHPSATEPTRPAAFFSALLSRRGRGAD